MEKSLDFYLEMVKSHSDAQLGKATSKGQREDWLDEEPEDEEDEESESKKNDSDEDDDKIEKIIDIIAELDPEIRKNDPWLKEKAEQIIKLFK